MKFMTTWSFPTGNIPEAAARFLAGEATPPPGVTILGRWHKADCSGGFVLVECSDPTLLYADAVKWADLLELHGTAVIEDGEAAPILANRFKK